MAEPKSDISQRMLELRTTSLGDIDEKSVDFLLERLLQFQVASSVEPIKLLINSQGGVHHGAIMLCDFMDHVITAPIHGIVVGKCHSAATFILLSCSVRKCTPHASFVIHNATTSGIVVKHDSLTEKNISDLTIEVKGITESMIQFYMDKLHLSRKRVQALLARGDQDHNDAMSAEEAVQIGLVQEIVKGKLDIFPTA